MTTDKEKYDLIRNLYLVLTVLNVKNQYAFFVPVNYNSKNNFQKYVNMYNNCYIEDINEVKYDLIDLISKLLNKNLYYGKNRILFTKYRNILLNEVRTGQIKRTVLK